MSIEFNEPEISDKEIEDRIKLISNVQDLVAVLAPPHTGKSWLKMTPEEQQEVRDYYDNTDFSHLMETEGVWEYPATFIWNDEPEQLELDLGVVSQWDETKPYTVGQMSFYFDRVLTIDQWNKFVIAVDEAVIHKGWPEFTLSAIMKSGRDRDLFPEAYEDESKESN